MHLLIPGQVHAYRSVVRRQTDAMLCGYNGIRRVFMAIESAMAFVVFGAAMRAEQRSFAVCVQRK